MSARRRGLALASSASALLLFGLVAMAGAAQSPGGRPYELVSPPEKRGVDLIADGLGGAFGLFAPTISADGNSVAFSTQNALPGSVSNGIVNRYRARRTAAGWTTAHLDFPVNPPEAIEPSAVHGFDEAFDSYVFAGLGKSPLTPDSSPDVPNLYLRQGGGLRLITVGATASSLPLASTPNLSHVVFSTSQLIGEDPQRGKFLYDWDARTGRPTLVEPLLDGIPAEDTTIAMPPETNSAGIDRWNPVSRDGSRILFAKTAAPQQLFVRIDGRETKHVSESQRVLSDANGPKPANFRFASDDGSRVFFTSAEKLTNDATTGAQSQGEDLYLYDDASGLLLDLTVALQFDPNSPNGAEVLGVLGGAQDGSRLYFVARGVLAPGGQAGAVNLYEWRQGGTPKGNIFHIATGVDPSNWTNDFFVTEVLRTPKRLTSRVTPDGTRLMFTSTTSLTGFPNRGHVEIYLFEVGKGLRCVSCNPAGTPATADALAVGTGDAPLPGARSLSDDGRRVFFSTSEQLLAQDTNVVADVYQFDAVNGSLSLISDGTSPFPAFFADATPSGNNVVFVTRARLLPIDQDGNFDAYDARIGGGLASQQGPPPAPPCSGAACRDGFGPPPAPADAGSRTTAAEAPPAQAPPKKKKKKKRKHRRGNRR